MYPRVLEPLSFDVLLNALFIAMLPHRAHEVPVAPKLSGPQLTLYFRTLPKYFPRRNALMICTSRFGLYIGTDCTKKCT